MSINFGLKPCPFCGSFADIYIEGNKIKAYCSIEDCGATKDAMYFFHHENEDRKLSEVIEDIIEEWNKRAEPPNRGDPR